MTSLTERIQSYRDAQASAELESRRQAEKARQGAQDLAAVGLRKLVKDKLDIDIELSDVIWLHVPANPNYNSKAQDYAAVNIEGLFFTVEHKEATAGSPSLCIAARCPNGHVPWGYARSMYSDLGVSLSHAEERQREVSQPGGCKICVKEGKSRSIKQQALDIARAGSRGQVTAMVEVLINESLFETYLEKAVRVAQGTSW